MKLSNFGNGMKTTNIVYKEIFKKKSNIWFPFVHVEKT